MLAESNISKFPPLIVLAFDEGGLGNRLFLYSEFMRFAQAYGYHLINPSFGRYADFFERTSNCGFCSYFPDQRGYQNPNLDIFVSAFKDFLYEPFKTHPKALAEIDEFSIETLGRAINMDIRTMLIGFASISADALKDQPGAYFNFHVIHYSENEFNLSSPAIRDRITPDRITLFQGWDFRCGPEVPRDTTFNRINFGLKRKHIDQIGTVISRARSGADLLIGVHIRRGDYEKFLGGKYYYPVSEYIRLMHELKSKFSQRRVAFLVSATDGLARTDFPGLNVHFSTGIPVEDMYALAECDALVGPPSTFTDWAIGWGGIPSLRLESGGMGVQGLELKPREHSSLA